MKPRTNPLITKEAKQDLIDAFGSLRTDKEIKLFLEDLLTNTEVVMLGKRLIVALMIKDGANYEEIIDTLHVGMGTITSVKKTLEGGSGGYELVIKRLKPLHEERRKKAIKEELAMQDGTWENLKKRYPHYHSQ